MIYAKPQFNPGGSITGGILQGMIAGQQSRESDKRMDFLQAQQDRKTQDYESTELHKRLYDMNEVKKNGGDVTANIEGLNTFFDGSTNFINEPRFSKGNWSDHSNGEPGYTNRAMNTYKSNTGKDLIAGETDKQAPIMFGDKFYDDETFGAGSGTYQTYAKDRRQQELINDAKIAKALETKEGSGKLTEMDYIDLKTKADTDGYDSLSDKEKSALDLGDEKFKMTKRNSRKTLFSPESGNISDSISKGEYQIPDDNQDKENYYLNAESANGVKLPNKQKIKDSISQVRTINELVNTWDGLSDKDIASGITENQTVDLIKKVSSEEFKTLKPSEQRKVLKTMQIRSETGMFGKKFVNAISGTAVSDDEFKTIMDILTGGPIDQNSVESIKAALSGAAGGMDKAVRGDIKSITKENVGSKMELFRMLQGANTFKGDATQPTQGGDKTMKQVAGSGIGKRVKEAGDSVKEVISNIFSDKAEDKLLPLVPKQSKESKSKDKKFFDSFTSLKDFDKAVEGFTKDQKVYYAANKRQIRNAIMGRFGD